MHQLVFLEHILRKHRRCSSSFTSMYFLHPVVLIHDLIPVNNCQTHHHSAISIHLSTSQRSPILMPIANFVYIIHLRSKLLQSFCLRNHSLEKVFGFCNAAYTSEQCIGRRSPPQQKVYSKQEYEHLERKYHYEYTNEIHKNA